MRDNSIAKDVLKLSAEKQVLAELKKAPLTRGQVVSLLPQIPINTIAGAIQRLLKQGKAHSVATGKPSYGGNHSMEYRIGKAPKPKREPIIIHTVLSSHWGNLPNKFSIWRAAQ